MRNSNLPPDVDIETVAIRTQELVSKSRMIRVEEGGEVHHGVKHAGKVVGMDGKEVSHGLGIQDGLALGATGTADAGQNGGKPEPIHGCARASPQSSGE